MKTVEVTFNGVEAARRQQNSVDEERGIVRHIFDVPAGNVSADVLVGLDGPNPRTPNTRKKAAKQLKESLLGDNKSTVGAFHLAHSGVRGIVRSFEKVNETTYRAKFDTGSDFKSEDHGIANGLHTIAVIQEAAEDGDIPPEQFVTFTLIENVDRALVPYVAEGLNTSIQVSEESIINLGEAFEPFKAEISKASYAGQIGWHENEGGPYDARDVFAILTALDVGRYPNEEKDRHPLESYEKQSACITAFNNEYKSKGAATTYHEMIPILRDALFLHDTIRSEAGERYKEVQPSGKPGGLAIMEARHRKDGETIPDVWEFPFISDGQPQVKRGTYRLAKGVTFAMLAAFRNFVEYDSKEGTMHWVGGFDTVLDQWKTLGGKMMVTAIEASKTVSYNATAVGKNRPLWRSLHQTAENERLRRELMEARG